MTDTPADMQTRVCTFGDLEISYDERVLEPRPWTTMQSRWAAELLGDRPDGLIVELCAGAGHIGLLAASLSGASLVCVDIDPTACDFARRNADAAGLGDRVEVRCRSLGTPGEEALADLVIADPPWVPRAEIGQFPEDPQLAIDGGLDGLDVARDCVVRARASVGSGADLLIQLGDQAQADSLGGWASESGWRVGELRHGERGVVLHLIAT